jgi:1-pyrroline-5-carboxylate dehydrogenase
MVTAEIAGARGEFVNEPLINFSEPKNRQAMEGALRKVAEGLGREYPILIGGESLYTEEKIRSTNPARPEQVIGVFQNGTVEMAIRAVETAYRAFDKWKRVPAEERAECLFRAREILLRRRLELDALLVYEIG